ncbi:MAG: hypothetical protein K8J31_02580, partial [Anaerolineae bacterium]|nr:hypothetical protein [Anaerolineae bacterium]
MIKQRPFISIKAIRAVLDGMLRGNDFGAGQSLLYLSLVDEFISQPHIPAMEDRREYAIRSILVDLIRREYVHHRVVVGLEGPRVDEQAAEALESIRADVLEQGHDLVGWSILYYRYARADVNLLPTDYAAAAHFDERTFRRHQAHALHLLQAALVDEESSMRRERKQRWLYAQLPDGIPERLVGRDQLADDVRELLRDNPPSWVLLTGSKGSGKTAFAQLLLRRMIDEDALDYVVWISQPPTVEYVIEGIRQNLLQDDSLNLADHLLRFRVAVVLDEILHLSSDVAALRQIFTELGGAMVMVTHTVFLDLSPKFKHIVLTDLDKPAVFEMVQRARLAASNEEVVEYAEILWQEVGGNPLAVQLAVHNLNNLSLERPLNSVENLLEQLVVTSYQAMSVNAQVLLWMLGLCPPEGVTPRTIQSLWASYHVTDHDFIELASSGLIQKRGRTQQCYSLRRDVYEGLPTLSERVPGASDTCTHLIVKLESSTDLKAGEGLKIMEYILLRGWPELSVSARICLAEAAYELGLKMGHFAAWGHILSQLTGEMNYRLMLAHAICLRKTARWLEAEHVLANIIQLT